MFYCERYRCRMDEKHCVHYQQIVRGSDMALFWVGDASGPRLMVYRHHCIDCGQGRDVAANYDPGNAGAGFTPARKEPEMARSTCNVEGCSTGVVAQGLCAPHYDKWRRGDPDMVKLKGGEFKIIRPLKRKRGTDKPPPPSPVIPARAGIQAKPAGNGQIQVPDFEAKVLYAIARTTGSTITECFLRCLRTGIETELGRL